MTSPIAPKTLLSPLSSLKRVGPAMEEALLRLTAKNYIFNLLLHFPSRIEKIIKNPNLADVANNSLVVIKAKIESHSKPSTSRQPYKILCRTANGYLTLTFFKIFPSQLEKLGIGREVAIMGYLQKILGENQINHPQEIIDAAAIDSLPQDNVIYPMTYALTPKFLRQKIEECLEILQESFAKKSIAEQEWIDKNLLQSQEWPSFVSALEIIHNYKTKQNSAFIAARANIESSLGRVLPSQDGSCLSSRDDSIFALAAINAPNSLSLGWQLIQDRAKKRLAYDELLAWQLALLLVKQAEEIKKVLPKIKINFADNFLQSMPFKPTLAQVSAAAEIKKDVLSTKKMLRLLQGDVGSGKTVLAIYACLLAISQNKQSCIIAPITILAEQHFVYLQKILNDAGFNVLRNDDQTSKNSDIAKKNHPDEMRQKIVIEILTGKQTKKKKAKILEDLRDGEIDILISTHAVLQDDVVFKDLAIAVIDEQHRFGVMQRLKLIEKGQNVDTLLMSATPIPRSLMMAMYGDMDISILNEKPQGRKEIATLVMSENKREEVFVAVKRALKNDEKIYWLCPAIEESEESELATAEEKFKELCQVFGAEKVALIHGRMKESEKEKVMENFVRSAQAVQILVATTVIEVGIDVKDATIIVIENAENFGLSQLHQLRGRVGRGLAQSYCILLYGKKYGAKGRERLAIMRASADGFYIAEEDLKMRGSGELVGTRQSGLPEFKIANLAIDADLLKIAHKNAQVILSYDAKLESAEGSKYRDLLKLFDYDRCLKIVGGG